MSDAPLTAQRVREVLDYDQETGIFTWRITRSSKSIAGRVAGCLQPSGYILLRVDYRFDSAHRLAVLWMTGAWPERPLVVDHINGVRSDNRWENLRCVQPFVNSQNRRGAQSNNSACLLGVRMITRGRSVRFSAKINVRGLIKHLGTYSTAEEAHGAYMAARRQFHEGNTL